MTTNHATVLRTVAIAAAGLLLGVTMAAAQTASPGGGPSAPAPAPVAPTTLPHHSATLTVQVIDAGQAGEWRFFDTRGESVELNATPAPTTASGLSGFLTLEAKGTAIMYEGEN